jgi:DNA-binding NtrC family response regulator
MKLLLVDDEVEILKMLKRRLAMEGFEVFTASTPREALELMPEHLFNIVITDIRMPEMTGIALVKELRKIHPLVNVIIITGFTSMSYIVECLATGAYDYFTKPLRRLEEFLEAVRQCRDRIVRWQGAISIGTRHDQRVAV